MKVMRIFITLSVVALILPLSAGVIAAVWLGRYDNTPIVTTLVQQQYQRGVQAQLMTQFIDLRRLYTLSQPLNKDYRVIDAQLWGAFHAHVITQYDDATLELRFVDLRRNGDPGTLIAAVVSPSSGVEVRHFFPSWSPDQNRIAFYDFVEEQSYVYDLETGQHHAIPGRIMNSPLSGFAWSPDGRQIAFRDELRSLVIVNADGENVRRLLLTNVGFFSPRWSQDSQGILIVHENLYVNGSIEPGRNAPIRLLDVNTMQVDEEIAEYQGDRPNWCDERWISFVHYLPGGRRVPYVLDTQTGELYNLGDNPMLADYDTQGLSFDYLTCEHVFITTRRRADPTFQNVVFLSDMSGNTVQKLIEGVPMYWLSEGSLTYMKQEADYSRTVYRASLDDLDHPEVVVNFRPPARLLSYPSFPAWIGNSGVAVVSFPDALYRLDGDSLTPLFGREDLVLEYRGWPED